MNPAASPDATDTADPRSFCDLVMKGGITSGVVYPLAILELAKSYRFKNIGGTSAGAMAAAVTAAAEYRRRNGSMGGYTLLGRLPKELGEPVNGRSRLMSLFQPQHGTQRLYAVLLSALNRGGTAQRWWGVVSGVLKAYGGFALMGAALADALIAASGGPVGVLGLAGAILLTLLLVLGAVAWGLYDDVVNGLVANGFGLCQCGPAPYWQQSHPPALTPWLHELIQRTAGLLPGDRPLTFQDLWDAPGSPTPVPGIPMRSINLQVFTTNLAHGRPHLLPLDDPASRLFFKRADLEPYFPQEVLDHVVRLAKPYSPASDSDPPASDKTRDLLELPGADLPILVAARLSLSFPFLISAVPLWAVDHEPKRQNRRLSKCWFSDGGICSNFPIHLFDGWVPMWPTFGITLGRPNVDRPGQPVWLTKLHLEGRGDTWDRFNDKPNALGRLGGFITSLFTTAQNWNDTASARMPGVRDRVAHIRLKPQEGGLNLDMPADLIATLAGYGQEAGEKLREKFAPAPDGRLPPGWTEHRWVRFNIVVHGLRLRLRELSASVGLGTFTLPIAEQIDDAALTPPLRGRDETPLTPAQAQSLTHLLAALEAAASAFGMQAHEPQPYQPVPVPSLRVRPPL